MRFNNQRAKNAAVTLYFIFAILFVFATVFFDVIKSFIGGGNMRNMFLFVVLGLVLFVAHRVSKYFEYDSEGNVLVIVNKGIMLSDFLNYREKRAEFPKKKLLYYKLNNYVFYKSLNLYISSHGEKQKRLKFNVTLVSDRKLKYLKQSLDKVVKQNKLNA